MPVNGRIVALKDKSNTNVFPETTSNAIYMDSGKTLEELSDEAIFFSKSADIIQIERPEIIEKINNIKNNADDWIAFKAIGGIISGPIKGVESSESHIFLEHSRVVNSRNVKNIFTSTKTNNYPSFELKIEDTTNSLSNGFVYMLGDGGSTYTHNYLRPLTPGNGTIENRLGSKAYPWDEVCLEKGAIKKSDEALLLEAFAGKSLMFRTSRTSDSRKGDLVLVNEENLDMFFRPSSATGTRNMHLGSSDFCFKSVWAGAYTHTKNGYTQLPNNMLMQWGEVTTTTGSVTTFNFPIAFPNNIFTVMATLVGGVAYSNMGVTSGFNSVSEGYVLQNTGATRPIRWIAIGH